MSSMKPKKKLIVSVPGEDINVESAVASSNTYQPVITSLVHGDPEKNSAITESVSVSSEDVIEVESKEGGEMVASAFIVLERPECPGLQEQKKNPSAPQGAPAVDDEKLKLEAEILEIDGGPLGPRGSPFKKKRDGAYFERDQAKGKLVCATNDYNEAVKMAAAEYESAVQIANAKVIEATVRVSKAMLFVEEVSATFRRRKIIQEQLDGLKNK